MKRSPQGQIKEQQKTEEINFIKSMQVLTLKEGDILVLKTLALLSDSNIKRINSIIDEYLPPNLVGKVKLMVLEEGMDIGVLREGK